MIMDRKHHKWDSVTAHTVAVQVEGCRVSLLPAALKVALQNVGKGAVAYQEY